MSGAGAQALVDRSELDLERVDDRQRDRDLLTRCDWQRLRVQPLAPREGEQLAVLRTAVVITLGT